MSDTVSAETNQIYQRQRVRMQGFFFDEFSLDSAWIRELGSVVFRAPKNLERLIIQGEFKPHPEALPAGKTPPALLITSSRSTRPVTVQPNAAGAWNAEVILDQTTETTELQLCFQLQGVAWTNFLAWLARIGADLPGATALQPYRAQNRNRQLRLSRIECDDEVVFDFANRHAPYSTAFARRHAQLGLNIVGFHQAELGIGESARCMIRAADAAELSPAVVPLKLHCKARQNDATYAARRQETNPNPVNIFHLDPPAAAEIDHHHGAAFRRQKYNIGYWAWELPEFPDAWVPGFDFFNEIWCPSDFVREAIAAKSPVPVFTMPHAIAFSRPTAGAAELRGKFGLPAEGFLFLFLYDLNSYSERKNPRAVIEAFRRSSLAARGASLVIKTHGASGNEAALAELRASLTDLPGTTLIDRYLTRSEVYELEAACDCFVSLHRSEGFGLSVAECMYLGKPVIATDWSATAEFLNAKNGCPVSAPLIQLDRHHGPYGKGQTWADPDVAHAAEWMQRLHADPALCTQLGTAARATMESKFSPAAIGARYRKRLEAIASW